MKPIKELLNHTTQKSGTHSKTKPEIDQKVIARLFGKLHSIYGHKWSSLIVDEDLLNDMIETWGSALIDVDPQSMKTAVDKLPHEYPNWPPTVGQFAELCEACKVVPYRPQLPKLRTEAMEQAAADAFAQIRGILK